MRTLFTLTIGFAPFLHAQHAPLLKSVEPQCEKYSPELTTNFDVASASVTLTVQANGKPFAVQSTNLSMPMAVVMALKDYEFLAEQPKVVFMSLDHDEVRCLIEIFTRAFA